MSESRTFFIRKPMISQDTNLIIFICIFIFNQKVYFFFGIFLPSKMFFISPSWYIFFGTSILRFDYLYIKHIWEIICNSHTFFTYSRNSFLRCHHIFIKHISEIICISHIFFTYSFNSFLRCHHLFYYLTSFCLIFMILLKIL